MQTIAKIKARRAAYYRRNKAAIKDKVTKYSRQHREYRCARSRERIGLFLAKAKDQPCTDCRNEFPHYLLEFDHCRGIKKFTIGGRGHSRTIGQLEAEVLKCDVVCVMCHKIREHERRQAKKASCSR